MTQLTDRQIHAALHLGLCVDALEMAHELQHDRPFLSGNEYAMRLQRLKLWEYFINGMRPE